MSNRDSDPTAIPIEFDPREQRMVGTAIHGDTPFDVPFVSHIEGNLWTGGCQTGLILPKHIVHLVSLYQWSGTRSGMLASESYHFYDAACRCRALARPVCAGTLLHDGRADIVHCQAGLNRSGLSRRSCSWTPSAQPMR